MNINSTHVASKEDWKMLQKFPTIIWLIEYRTVKKSDFHQCGRWLQYVMNAAAKVITCKRTFDHATPLLIELHWLPVRQRIVLKILLYRLQRTWLSSSVLMFLGELLGLLTNFYWSSQRTSSNWLAWGLSQCARLTSGTGFHLRLKAAHLSLSLKLSLRPIFFDKHIFRLSIFFLFLIFRTFRLLIFSILRIFYIF